MLKLEEQGRSMIEILGVLAVMAVLSVGGVAGYMNAMNKHHANELLNEATKRAVSVATQVLAGKKEAISLVEFGVTTVGEASFDTNPVDISGSTFSIKINHVPTGICKYMKNSIGSKTVIQDIPEACGSDIISLVYNKDLSKGNLLGGTTGGSDDEEQETNPTSCSDNRAVCGTECCEPGDVCGNSNGEYACLTLEGEGCTKNSDCPSGKFCAIEGYTGVVEVEEIGVKDCVVPKTGICASNWDELGNGNNNTYWSAENYCLSQGKQLASLSSLGYTNNYHCSPSGECLEALKMCASLEEVQEVESCDECFGGLCAKRYVCEDEPDTFLDSCTCDGECTELLTCSLAYEADYSSNECSEWASEISTPFMCSDSYLVESCVLCDGECTSFSEIGPCFRWSSPCRFYSAGYEGVFWLKDNIDSCKTKVLSVFDTLEETTFNERDGNMDYNRPLCIDSNGNLST